MFTFDLLVFYSSYALILKYFRVPLPTRSRRSGFTCRWQRSLPISLGRFLICL